MDLAWYIPVLIFFARICDVSIGTVRMIFVIAGWRGYASVLGFVEVLIWASAVGGLIAYITHPLALLAFAGGFAVGNFTGMFIEQRISLGIRLVRVINGDREVNVSSRLRELGYRVTRIEGTGRDGPVELTFVVVKRRYLAKLLHSLESIAPEAVVTVERADYASASALVHDGAPDARRGWFGLAGVRK